MLGRSSLLRRLAAGRGPRLLDALWSRLDAHPAGAAALTRVERSVARGAALAPGLGRRGARALRAALDPRPADAAGLRVGLIGNIANNAFNMVNILRGVGVTAELVDYGGDLYAFARPFWEELPLVLPKDDVMHRQRSFAEWLDYERELGWDPAGRVVRPSLDQTRLRRFLDDLAPVEPPPTPPELPAASQEFLRQVWISHRASIEALAGYDVLIAFGTLPAICAWWARRPTIYFTYGGDCRVELANRGGQHALLSSCLDHVLHSDRFALEAYGCDEEIHGVLADHGLLDKAAYAYLPNVNTALFGGRWCRASARQRLGWREDARVFFLASRVDYYWKRSDLFLEAFAEYAASHPDAELWVTGWGQDYDHARAQLEAGGVLDRVTFLPDSYSKPELFLRYAAADVIVDQFGVGSLGSVSFEALCMGKPVLTYLAPFNLQGYPTPPPLLNARTRADILAALEATADAEALRRLGEDARRWYADVYAARRLTHAVEVLHQAGPAAWPRDVASARPTLPVAALPVPDAPQASLRVLPWPYPFRAGLTLANDCEYYAWDDFVGVHRWLDGLGLRVSDAFWCFSEDPDQLGFSYFAGDDPTRRGPHAEAMAELLRLGRLDTLHTYGGFDLRGGFRRAHAEAAAAELERLGVELRVWSNHGNANNRQNLGGLSAADYTRGDLRGHEAYHADLLARIGVRYVWLDAHATNRFSLGTAAGREFTSAFSQPDPSPWGDRLLLPERLRDGQALLAFRRFRGRRALAPDPSSLADQLAPEHLDHLVASGGGAAIYQHLGCRRLANGTPVSRAGESLPAAAVAACEALAQRAAAGEIWVAPSARFLAYLDVVQDLRVALEGPPSGLTLRLSRLHGGLRESDLAGVCLRLDGPARVARVELQGLTGAVEARDHRVEALTTDAQLVRWAEPDWPRFPL